MERTTVMEYLFGFYLIGFVVTSLYISASVYARPYLIKQMGKINLIATGILTCMVWPVFLGWVINDKLKGKRYF